MELALVVNVGDTRPAITATLSDSVLGVVDLTVATSMTATLFNATGATMWTRGCSGNNLGVVTVPWTVGDTDIPGQFYCQFKVTWPDGTVQRFPVGRPLPVQVVAPL